MVTIINRITCKKLSKPATQASNQPETGEVGRVEVRLGVKPSALGWLAHWASECWRVWSLFSGEMLKHV